MKKLGKIPLLELDEAYQKGLTWFFSYPDKQMSLNDLSAELKISKTTANQVVTQLIKEGFLQKEVIGRTWRISCNKGHLYNFSRKVAFNLSMIYEAGLLDIIHDTIDNCRAVILFGSYRKGDDNEKSDIDIAVEVLSDKYAKIVELGTLPQLGFRKNIAVNLYIFSRNKIDLNLFSNIANGIVLEGFLEVRP